MINSALVSGQHRKRCYWTNIPNVTQPDDKGILLQDILENGVSWQDKCYCMTANYHPTFQSNLERHQNSMVAMAVCTVNGKSHTIPATYYKAGTNLFPSYAGEKSRQKIAVPVKTEENENGGKTVVETLAYTNKPVRIGKYGKGGQAVLDAHSLRISTRSLQSLRKTSRTSTLRQSICLASLTLIPKNTVLSSRK